ncbi:hypothetical protein C8R45DRAFT_931575 [Mycena sanguinolenta]|nr:hypothetical protein C8R45DRAFT_931575 [Mycena sanguinolenta]
MAIFSKILAKSAKIDRNDHFPATIVSSNHRVSIWFKVLLGTTQCVLFGYVGLDPSTSVPVHLHGHMDVDGRRGMRADVEGVRLRGVDGDGASVYLGSERIRPSDYMGSQLSESKSTNGSVVHADANNIFQIKNSAVGPNINITPLREEKPVMTLQIFINELIPSTFNLLVEMSRQSTSIRFAAKGFKFMSTVQLHTGTINYHCETMVMYIVMSGQATHKRKVEEQKKTSIRYCALCDGPLPPSSTYYYSFTRTSKLPTDKPLDVARNRATQDPMHRDAPPELRADFARDLHKRMKSAVPSLPDFEEEWPRCMFAGQMRARFQNQQAASSPLVALSELTHSLAGFLYKEVLNIRNSATTDIDKYFTEAMLKGAPKAKAWVDSDGVDHSKKFDRMKTVDFKRYLNDRAKRDPNPRKRKKSSSDEDESRCRRRMNSEELDKSDSSTS